MGRPPCCDKEGVKKGPWTPEEDIVLVSYVQEHGPGNWRSVPTTTGLRRCSKSCRLRWTNYLRPGIKRGTFTDQEEKMIIQLQALLGNKWAAIASYLPERTDNDIKNYWNTHLKKKIKKLQTGSSDQPNPSHGFASSDSKSICRGQWERRLQADMKTAKQALQDALSSENTATYSTEQLTVDGYTKPSSYASSTENIARLLKNWVKSTPKSEESKCCSSTQLSSTKNTTLDQESSVSEEAPLTPSNESKRGIDLSEAFESLFGFESSTNSGDEVSRSTSPYLVHGVAKPDPDGLAGLSILENWLLDYQEKDYLANFSFDENPNLF